MLDGILTGTASMIQPNDTISFNRVQHYIQFDRRGSGSLRFSDGHKEKDVSKLCSSEAAFRELVKLLCFILNLKTSVEIVESDNWIIYTFA
jgi:hypothetical protein